MTPQIIMIILFTLGLYINIEKHGKIKKDKTYNGWAKLLIIAIHSLILYYGGFWDELNI